MCQGFPALRILFGMTATAVFGMYNFVAQKFCTLNFHFENGAWKILKAFLFKSILARTFR